MATAQGIKLLAALVAIILLLGGLVACQPEDVGFGVDDLPDGDATHGAALFTESINGAPKCSACHTLDEGRSTGPSLQDYAGEARDRVKGQNAETYTFTSILRPAKHIVQGYSNVMYEDYENKLSRQEIADLIAFLLTLD
jgi:mono/diheme cytochrome c family protein